MQKDGSTLFVEEIEHTVARFTNSEPSLAELALNLRSVRKVEGRASKLK